MRYTKNEILERTKGAALVETYVFSGNNHRVHTDNLKYVGPGSFDNGEIDAIPYVEGEADVDIYIMDKEEYEGTVLANSSDKWPEELSDNDKIAVVIVNK